MVMKLMAVTDGRHPVLELAKKIMEVEPHVNVIQLREKTKTAKEIWQLLDYLADGGVPKEKLVMNDRLDIAVCGGIQTVHLPEQGLPVQHVKERFPYLKIGKSVHDFAGAVEAEQQGADYVLYGHCFETNSKKGQTPNGITPIVEMKANLRIPVFAIGGIHVRHVDELRAVQVDGIAVMSNIFSAQQPAAAAIQLKKVMQNEEKL